ncbi:MAG: hypothetical protein JWO95_3282 [Verrucomicrobiales bacterium]|nr:hypothetical protein [Verrucomicrobiales bacterium]
MPGIIRNRMKIWPNIFAAFKISAAHDDRERLAPSLKAKIARSPELCSFESATSAMERRLMSAARRPKAPPQLHSSIMRAVRTSRCEAESTRARVRWTWEIPAAAAAIIVVLVLNFFPATTDVTQPSAPIVTAPTFSVASIAQQNVAEPLSPLLRERDDLTRDLQQTAEFLTATIP